MYEKFDALTEVFDAYEPAAKLMFECLSSAFLEYELDGYLAGETHLELRSPAILYYDERAGLLTDMDITLIQNAVKNRLFVNGRNSFDAQMLPAISYKPPRGLYRYLSGDLFRSCVVSGTTPGVLSLNFRYDPLIMAVLDERYGQMFRWSPSDVEFVNRIVRDRLISLGIPDETPPELVEKNRLQTELYDAAEAARRSEFNQTIPLAEPQNIDPEVYTGVTVPNPPSDDPKTGAYKSTNFVTFDDNARLSDADLDDIHTAVVYRIGIVQNDASGNPLPQYARNALTDATLRSLKITRNGNGQITMTAEHKSPEIRKYELTGKQIFNFSNDEVTLIANIVKTALAKNGLAPTVFTQRRNPL